MSALFADVSKNQVFHEVPGIFPHLAFLTQKLAVSTNIRVSVKFVFRSCDFGILRLQSILQTLVSLMFPTIFVYVKYFY